MDFPSVDIRVALEPAYLPCWRETSRAGGALLPNSVPAPRVATPFLAHYVAPGPDSDGIATLVVGINANLFSSMHYITKHFESKPVPPSTD